MKDLEEGGAVSIVRPPIAPQVNKREAGEKLSVFSELQVDGDICTHCRRLLYRYYGGHHSRNVLREYHGELVEAWMVDVKCQACGRVTEIYYSATPLGRTRHLCKHRKPLFACAPAV
jgi:hypothetical protein